MAATMDPTATTAAASGANGTSMDLILQVPLAAAFVLLAILSLLQVLLPRPLSKQVCAAVRWATHNTVLATMLATLAAGMLVAVAATGAQLRFLYLSNTPPAAPPAAAMSDSTAGLLHTTTPTASGGSRGMAAAAGGLSATTTQGQQLWTTLLLAIANIVLTVNVWGHAREQAQAAQAKADSKVALRQAEAAAAAAPAGVTATGGKKAA